MNIFVLLVFLLCFDSIQVKMINMRPIIGILTQPDETDLLSFIDAAYVKWLESGGARVVPVPFDADEKESKRYFSSLNGLLLAGGSLNLWPNTTYYQSSDRYFQMSRKAFSKGDYFPIWGTCEGFQLLGILSAQDPNVLETYAFDSENLPLPLNFTSLAPKSRMWSISPELYNAFQTQNITINLHHDGILPDTFSTNSKMASFLNLLSTNDDRKGKPFGSSFEGKVEPIYGVQFHPERNTFEWDIQELVEHSAIATRAMQSLANFFVNEARKNQHKFKSTLEESKALIYNWNPLFTINSKDSYPSLQTYYFKNISSPFE
jgi:gamma-glutamyl hydrolase